MRSNFPGRKEARRKTALRNWKKVYNDPNHIPKRYKDKNPTAEQLQEYREKVVKPQIERLQKILGTDGD